MANTLRKALQFVDADKLYPYTNYVCMAWRRYLATWQEAS